MRFPKPRSAHESANRTVVDHIGAKPFFEPIGEQDNRNRRRRQPYSVKIKLMGFDYVFARRGHQYLAMETEKLDYFSGNQGIDRSYLPGRVYHPKERPDQDVPIRGQVPALPLGRAWRGASCGLFLLHRRGGQKALGLRHLLAAQYRDLFARLDSFRVVYVTADQSMFPKAESIFSRLCGGSGRGPNGMPLDPESGDCWIMFYDRDLLERRQTASFDKRQLEQLSHELREFRGPKYEILFRHWQQQGEGLFLNAMGAEDDCRARAQPNC